MPNHIPPAHPPQPEPQPAPQPPPAPEPEVRSIQLFVLHIIVCMSRLLCVHLDEIPPLVQELEENGLPLPQPMLDLINLEILSPRQKRVLFERMIVRVLNTPLGRLYDELLQQQRTVEAWQTWRNPDRYQSDSVIFLVVIVAILATHDGINVAQHIAIFQPFVEHHIRLDQRIAPLREMLLIPEVLRDRKLIWRRNIERAFAQLCENFCQYRVCG